MTLRRYLRYQRAQENTNEDKIMCNVFNCAMINNKHYYVSHN